MIPAEAVEAAAKALKEQDRPYSYPLPSYMEEAKGILEAAAPYMHDTAAETRLMAMVWTEAYGAGFQEGAGYGARPNPYRPTESEERP